MKAIRIHTLIAHRRFTDLRPMASAFSILVLIAALCSESAAAAPRGTSAFNGFNVRNAIIPVAEIRSGGPPRDGIPSIDRPKFIRTDQVDYLRPDDLVVSVTAEGKTRAYPLRILVWHEIVNDQMGTQAFAVTYCPLCGTAMVFDRRINGRTLTFGVSGLLYQSDMLLYDRQTESLWSQLAMASVAGKQVNTELTWLPSEHLTWAAWKQKHPKGQVLSLDTGFNMDYFGTVYAGYETSPGTMFPVPVRRTELPTKEWVIGVIVDGIARAYPLRSLPANQIVRDEVNHTALEITFDPVSQHAVVRQEETGNSVSYVKAYWFAWQAFYPQTGIWRVR
jgi:hypothetical protein